MAWIIGYLPERELKKLLKVCIKTGCAVQPGSPLLPE